MPFDAVLFDLDNTLLDHDGAAAEAVTAAFPDVDPDVLVPRWAELTDIAVDRYLAGELTFAEQRRFRITALAADLGLGAWDDARADAWIAAYVPRYEAAWRPFPDAAPALAALAGLRLGVITNGHPAQQRAKVAALGLELPYVLTSAEAGCAKPAARIFTTACAALGLAPARVAYVGDRLDVDARGASSAGLRGVWLDRSGAGPDVPDVPRVTTLTDAVALLTRPAG
ncbi:Pyrimidine 5'-nucleotidase YjjG [Actinomadura rubteroloni]|uniref:Pyrimidine 5'-nucleotidase YjjG n=1 Tax=Actinomadura rubteroloni TaxID=1926885 RepID=A0A2P4URX2_9ACTN|nr:HAD family hydrolase [Actinomadura rubteroloni]POM27799.1 Pyrimidine 5'-nucleotidase YjjG [Actinomadura rubteroloni]